MSDVARDRPDRRAFLVGTALSATALVPLAASRAGADPAGASDDFTFEVQRTEAEWREMLTADEYAILREAATEVPKSSPFWDQTTEGTYCCKGCNLTLYDSQYQVVHDKGWVFFRHSRANAILTSIEGELRIDGPFTFDETRMEGHCRRCGSHIGHFVMLDDMLLHCMNGASMTFLPTNA